MIKKIMTLSFLVFLSAFLLSACQKADDSLTNDLIAEEGVDEAVDEANGERNETESKDGTDQAANEQDDSGETKSTEEGKESNEGSQAQELQDYIDLDLVGLNGESIKLSDYEGKFLALNFFGVWCKYCIEEMPDLEKVYSEYEGDDFELLLINATTTEEIGQEGVIEWYNENNWSMPIAFDLDGTALATYPVSGFPTTYFINKEGKVLGAVNGMLTEEKLLYIIDEFNK